MTVIDAFNRGWSMGILSDAVASARENTLDSRLYLNWLAQIDLIIFHDLDSLLSN